MNRRLDPLIMRRVGLILAALGVLLGFGVALPPAGLSGAVPNGGPDVPSQAWLLPASAQGPMGMPVMLREPLPIVPDGLQADAPASTPRDSATLDPPTPHSRPMAAARIAALAWKGSVLNRVRLSPHAPPVPAAVSSEGLA